MTASPRAVTSPVCGPTTCRSSKAAVPIRLPRGERRVLQARAARARAEQRDVLRARIVLAAAARDPNAVIASRLGVTVDTVRKVAGPVRRRGP